MLAIQVCDVASRQPLCQYIPIFANIWIKMEMLAMRVCDVSLPPLPQGISLFANTSTVIGACQVLSLLSFSSIFIFQSWPYSAPSSILRSIQFLTIDGAHAQ